MSDSNEVGGFLILALGAALWYRVSEHSRANDLQDKLTTAEAQVDDLKCKTAALSEASDNLKQQLDCFGTENWRDAVPDAKDAGDDVDSVKDDLQSSADDAAGSDDSDSGN